MKRPVVAIDGPAGAGKSTVARKVAERLDYVLLDTGALYRTVALAAERKGISWDDADAVAQFAGELAAKRAVQLERGAGGALRVLLSGEDVSGLIRTQSIGQGASKVSAVPGVRAALLSLQRSAGEGGGVVLEGRDIGTVVFPDAEVKLFLTASVEVRAAVRPCCVRACWRSAFRCSRVRRYRRPSRHRRPSHRSWTNPPRRCRRIWIWSRASICGACAMRWVAPSTRCSSS
jgi:cytidylate kinase